MSCRIYPKLNEEMLSVLPSQAEANFTDPFESIAQ